VMGIERLGIVVPYRGQQEHLSTLLLVEET
jgi:hypothetical protein